MLCMDKQPAHTALGSQSYRSLELSFPLVPSSTQGCMSSTPAREKNNFILHSFTSFLENGGEHLRKFRFDSICENWLFLLAPLLPFLLGNPASWISGQHCEQLQPPAQGCSAPHPLAANPALRLPHSLWQPPFSPVLFPSPWRAFPAAPVSLSEGCRRFSAPVFQPGLAPSVAALPDTRGFSDLFN